MSPSTSPSVGCCLACVACGLLGYIVGCQANKPTRAPRLQSVAPEVLSELYDPPKRHGAVRVPSVVTDARGEVHNMQIGGFRFNVLLSEKGTLRSGDVHRADQLDFIFEGSVLVTTRESGRDV